MRLKWSVRVAKTALWPVQLRLGIRRLIDELGGVTFWVDPIFQNAFEKNTARVRLESGPSSASAGVPLGAS